MPEVSVAPLDDQVVLLFFCIDGRFGVDVSDPSWVSWSAQTKRRQKT